MNQLNDEGDEEWYRKRFGTADVWLIAAGRDAGFWQEFRERSIATIGWPAHVVRGGKSSSLRFARWPMKGRTAAIRWYALGDLSEYRSREDIHSALIESGAGQKPNHASLALWEFAHEMRIGDVLVATKGLHTVLGWGKVTGDYTYDSERKECANVRSVEWHPCIPPVEVKEMVSQKTLTRLTSEKKQLRGIFRSIEDKIEDNDGPISPPPPEPDPPKPNPYDPPTALRDLFIEETQFRRILDSFALHKNMILQGPPGVGKTFIARRIAWCLIGRRDSEPIEMVQFHQSYAYEDFVQGWRPTETGGFRLRNGVFFEFCKRAEQQPETRFVFIIDEINRGHLSRIFGELLMLIESDKRGPDHAIAMTYGAPGERFSVPDNVHLLGLMNTADRSLAMLDYALRRRFAFETLEPAYGTRKFREYLLEADVDQTLVDRIDRNLSALNERIRDDKDLGPGFRIGHSYFVPDKLVPDKLVDEQWYLNVIDTQIAPLLREYWFDRPEQVVGLVEDLRR